MTYSDPITDDIYVDSQRIDREVANGLKAVPGVLLVLIVSILIVTLWSWALLHFTM